MNHPLLALAGCLLVVGLPAQTVTVTATALSDLDVTSGVPPATTTQIVPMGATLAADTRLVVGTGPASSGYGLLEMRSFSAVIGETGTVFSSRVRVQPIGSFGGTGPVPVVSGATGGNRVRLEFVSDSTVTGVLHVALHDFGLVGVGPHTVGDASVSLDIHDDGSEDLGWPSSTSPQSVSTRTTLTVGVPLVIVARSSAGLTGGDGTAAFHVRFGPPSCDAHFLGTFDSWPIHLGSCNSLTVASWPTYQGYRLTIPGVPQTGVAAFALGLTPPTSLPLPTLPNCYLRVAPDLIVPALPDANGVASVTLPLNRPISFGMQAFVFDVASGTLATDRGQTLVCD